jgi:DNA-binding GntR family transcriptional regulator
MATMGDGSSSEANRVYDALRNKILTLDLDPGASLDEARIVEEMGTSRTPVREAVIRLVSEGLLRRDGRQIRVSSFEVGHLRALFEAMTLLSRTIYRMAAARRSAQQLAIIRDALIKFESEVAQGDEVRISEANHLFHEAIAEAADSLFIRRAYGDLLIESLRLARQCFAAGDSSESTRHQHLARTSDDHRKIYEAIEQRDVEEADRLASEHCTLFRDRLSRQMLGPSAEATGIPLTN